MCGIAGIWFRNGRPGAEAIERARSMARRQRHRGPDDDGVLARQGAVLSFARLSIIDLEGGHQPMVDAGGEHAIVFNGEIYNFRELRADLLAEGANFRTRSDSEVLLEGLARHGASFVQRTRGMFGFALHHQHANQLLLARDRLGIKPLYYADRGDALVFASEIKGILASGLVSREIDPVALVEYLSFGYVAAPRTIYAGIRCLPPGHLLRTTPAGVSVERYWSVSRVDVVPRSIDEAAEQLEELLRSAIRARLIADVPLGALLSGGLDSGLIVALMAQVHDEPIRTFSIGFREERYDELPWAKLVAQRYGTRHTELVCEPDVREMIPRILDAHDQPFGDSSALPMHLVSELARCDVTVALSGDGGDEVFAGYARHTRFVAQRSAQDLIRLGTRPVARVLARMLPPAARGAQRLRRAGLSAAESRVDAITLGEPRVLRMLAGEKLRAGDHLAAVHAFARAAGDGYPADDELARFQHQDLLHYLPNDILTKVDIASMQHSLELRVPLLDHEIVQFGINLPTEWKNDGHRGKLVLRKLAEKHLPREHLQKRKSGFSIPLSSWLAGPLRPMMLDHLRDSKLAADGWLSQRAIDHVVAQQLAGRPRAYLLWLLMGAEHWYRGEGDHAAAG